MSDKFTKSEELIANLKIVDQNLTNVVELTKSNIRKMIAALETGNYKKKPDTDEYPYEPRLWSTDGKGFPVIDAENVLEWGETNELVEEFFEEFSLINQ